MRAKGISYDTGFIRGGAISRKHFDPDVVKRELCIIRDDLHCTAVRVIGGDPQRLELAATTAADLGLELWFSPYPLELTTEDMLSLFADCAVRAERLRQRGAEIVFVRVDWTLFDIVSVDLYRSAEVADQFSAGVGALVAQGKPVAITEFGIAAYRGAGDRGARFMEIIEYDKDTGAPIRLNGQYVRDEEGQATYLRELLEIFDAAGVDSAFVFLFALDGFPHRPDGDPRDDLDLASPGIVKMLDNRHGDAYPDLSWEPKAAFTVLAGYYRG
jgi:hypothetical protein